MKIEEYKAGEKRMCYQYECLIPSLVNHEWTWGPADMTLALERAVKALAGNTSVSITFAAFSTARRRVIYSHRSFLRSGRGVYPRYVSSYG